MPEKNILIADDDQVILDILKEMIQREGYKVFLASNGKEAVEAIKINPIDLAILDIKMPVMDGIEALEEIKKIDQGIEVLIMTGYADLETLTQAISDHGAFDYILKPFKRADILNGIQNALLKRDLASQKKPREKEPEERILQLEKEFHERTHQLRESQIKYKDIVENSNDAIVVIQDEKLKFANTKTVELTGYPQEELKDMSFLEMVHPEDRNMVEEGYKREDFPGIFSFRALRKSGESLFVEINTVRTTWEKRQATLNVIRDITERKRAEKALKEEALRRSILMDGYRDGIAIINQEHKVVEANQRFAEMLGYTPEEVISLHTWDWEAVMDEAEIRANFADLTETNVVFETCHRRKDGTIFEVEVSACGERVGDRPMVITISRDITERKKAAEALRESEERYRLLAENTLDVIWKIDLNLEFTYVNSAILDTLGFTPEEWIGTRLPEHCSPEKIQKIESIIAHELENLEKHTGVVFEANFFNKNGEEIPGEVNGKILFDENGKPIGFQGSSRDITERKLAEEALRESETQKKALLDASIDRIRFVDTDMKIIWANKTTTRELNVAPEDLIGQFCYKALIGKDTPCHECPTTKALKTGNIEQAILHHPYSKGTKGETYWDTYAVPIKNESGDILNFIQVSRNITERKQAEEQLSRHTEQINKHKLALQKLAKMDFADFDVALKSTTELASQSLEAERVCVWLFNEDQSEMVCQDLYQLSHDSHEKGLTLKSKDYPNYFRALKEKRTIAADDAQNHPLTNELTEGYLKPLGITSRLSAAILLQSDFVGGVSAEHTGPLREWSEEEQTFLISIADLVTLALEIARRQQTEIELKKHRGRLEELVEGRTAELKEEISERKKAEEELQRNVEDLERFSKLAVGREEQMIKLKKEINELLRGLGQPDKYKIVD